MDRIQSPSTWRALTVPQLHHVIRSFPIFMVGRSRIGNKTELIQFCITGFLNLFMDHVETVIDPYSAQYPNDKEFIRNLPTLLGEDAPDFNNPLPANSNRSHRRGAPAPLPNPDVDDELLEDGTVSVVSSSTGRGEEKKGTKRSSSKKFTANQFVKYVMQNPNAMKLDPSVLKGLYSQKHNKYGIVTPIRAYPAFLDLASHTKQIRDIPKRSAVGRNHIPFGIRNQIIGVIRGAIAPLHSFFQSFVMDPVKPSSWPSIPNIQIFEVFDDTGAEPESSDIFPRAIFGNSWLKVTTVPYGLNVPSYLDQVVSIYGSTLSEYGSFYKIFNVSSTIRTRTLLYWLSRVPISGMIVDSTIKTPYDRSPIDAYRYIMNLPHVAAQLVGHPVTAQEFKRYIETYSMSIKRQIPSGSEFHLFRYFKANPEVYAKIHPPSTGNLPFHIEDYIPEEVWTSLPAELQAKCTEGKRVENPYLYIGGEDQDILEQVADARDIVVDDGSEAEQLNEYDKIDPTWVRRVEALGSSIEAMTDLQLLYYLGTQGITIGLTPREVGRNNFARAVLSITHAGGIQNKAENATPVTEAFIEQIIPMGSPSSMYSAMCHQFGIPMYDILTEDDIREIFRRGYIHPLPLPYHLLVRATKWYRLTSGQQLLMSSIYGFPLDQPGHFCTYTDAPMLEGYVERLSPKGVPGIIADLDMRVPSGTDPMEYVIRSLPYYQAILDDRPHNFDSNTVPITFNSLRTMRDAEIFNRLGVHFAHTDREDLVSIGLQLGSGGTGFFIPHTRRCVNAMTIATLESTADLSIFMIAYGTLDSYMCYELDELDAGFSSFGENNNLFAYRIYDIKGVLQDISREEAMSLSRLVTNARNSMTIDEQKPASRVVASIRRVEESFRGASEYDRSVNYRVSRFDADVQGTIRTYLNQLFVVGMYLRRWRGPPYPYPLLEKDTKSDTDPTTSVLGHLGGLGDILMEIEKLNPEAGKLVSSLRQVEHSKGRVRQSDADGPELSDLIRSVISGSYCIRIASTYFIGTGAFYMKLFFNYDFPGYDASVISSIT